MGCFISSSPQCSGSRYPSYPPSRRGKGVPESLCEIMALVPAAKFSRTRPSQWSSDNCRFPFYHLELWRAVTFPIAVCFSFGGLLWERCRRVEELPSEVKIAHSSLYPHHLRTAYILLHASSPLKNWPLHQQMSRRFGLVSIFIDPGPYLRVCLQTT